MTSCCVVPGCRPGNQKRTSDLAFFPVPSDKFMLEMWQAAIPGHVELQKGQRICSKHFHKNDIIFFRDKNNVPQEGTPLIRSKLSEGAIPFFSSDTLYDELTLIPHVESFKTTLKKGVKSYNVKTQGRNNTRTNQKEVTASETGCETSNVGDKVCISTETPEIIYIDKSDSETDSPDIKNELSISGLRESIQNDLEEYVRCRTDLEQVLEQNMDIQTNCNVPLFSFDKLFTGAIPIKIPISWHKILPLTNDKVVVFANFTLRTDKQDQILVSYKSISIGEDQIPKCRIMDKSVNNFPSECITSSDQLESIITKFDKALVCAGVVLGNEFAYLYSPLCYIDKQGHWRHVGCSLITTPGYETCISCKEVLQILSNIKTGKNTGPKRKKTT